MGWSGWEKSGNLTAYDTDKLNTQRTQTTKQDNSLGEPTLECLVESLVTCGQQGVKSPQGPPQPPRSIKLGRGRASGPTGALPRLKRAAGQIHIIMLSAGRVWIYLYTRLPIRFKETAPDRMGFWSVMDSLSFWMEVPPWGDKSTQPNVREDGKRGGSSALQNLPEVQPHRLAMESGSARQRCGVRALPRRFGFVSRLALASPFLTLSNGRAAGLSIAAATKVHSPR
jgi:hypothetical protein